MAASAFHETSGCICSLLTFSGHDQISGWSDFSCKNEIGCTKTVSRPKRQQRTSRLVYDNNSERYKFQHHEAYSDFIKDYNEVHLKSATQRHSHTKPLQYGGPYSSRPSAMWVIPVFLSSKVNYGVMLGRNLGYFYVQFGHIVVHNRCEWYWTGRTFNP